VRRRDASQLSRAGARKVTNGELFRAQFFRARYGGKKG